MDAAQRRLWEGVGRDQSQTEHTHPVDAVYGLTDGGMGGGWGGGGDTHQSLIVATWKLKVSNITTMGHLPQGHYKNPSTLHTAVIFSFSL